MKRKSLGLDSVLSKSRESPGNRAERLSTHVRVAATLVNRLFRLVSMVCAHALREAVTAVKVAKIHVPITPRLRAFPTPFVRRSRIARFTDRSRVTPSTS